MYYHKQRKAFSMLTAIVVIVLMASVGAFVMSLSGKMVKTTTTQFQREQAMLLAKSYTEYAIMAVMSNDRNNPTGGGACLNTIKSDDVIRPEGNGGFNIRVNIAYIGNDGTTPSGPPNILGLCTGSNVLARVVNTLQSPLNIIVDVYVKYKDLDGGNTNWITYHKRTLQKI